MKNLSELALEATRKNVVKSTRKENINDSMLRILFEDGKKLDRVELVAQISLDRLTNEHGEEALVKMVKNDREQFNKLMLSTNRTVKNGVDTSISRSNSNASFHNNPKYAEYKLAEVNGKFQITLKSKK